MERFRVWLAAVLSVAALTGAGFLAADQAEAQGRSPLATPLEYNTDRFGSDYRSIDVRTPEQCRATCERDGRCQAFTFVRAGIQAPSARCHLKDAVPEPTSADCCVSGVPNRAAYSDAHTPMPGRALEPGINRFGGDLRSVAGFRGDARACQAACQAEGQCRSFSWVRPGVQGPAPMCWLKNEIPEPSRDDCCTSGVVR